MITESTLELLKSMKLSAMASELQHQMEDPYILKHKYHPSKIPAF